MIQEPEDLPESQTLEAVLKFLVDSGKGDIHVCFGRVVGYDPDFRKEVGDFFYKAISSQLESETKPLTSVPRLDL